MTPSELSAWRKNERTRVMREREGLAQETVADLRLRIDHHLERAFPDLVHATLAFCWPHRNEYDARHLAPALRPPRASTAPPVVVAVLRGRARARLLRRGPEDLAQPRNSRYAGLRLSSTYG